MKSPGQIPQLIFSHQSLHLEGPLPTGIYQVEKTLDFLKLNQKQMNTQVPQVDGHPTSPTAQTLTRPIFLPSEGNEFALFTTPHRIQ